MTRADEHPEKRPCKFLSAQTKQLCDVIPLLPKSTVPGRFTDEVGDLIQKSHDDFLLHAQSCQDCADVVQIAGILEVSA